MRVAAHCGPVRYLGPECAPGCAVTGAGGLPPAIGALARRGHAPTVAVGGSLFGHCFSLARPGEGRGMALKRYLFLITLVIFP